MAVQRNPSEVIKHTMRQVPTFPVTNQWTIFYHNPPKSMNTTHSLLLSIANQTLFPFAAHISPKTNHFSPQSQQTKLSWDKYNPTTSVLLNSIAPNCPWFNTKQHYGLQYKHLHHHLYKAPSNHNKHYSWLISLPMKQTLEKSMI